MKMLKLLGAALAACALSFGLPAVAADNYTVKDSTGATKTICAKDVSSVYSTCNVIQNAAGSTINPATSDLQTTANTKLDTLHTDLTTLNYAGTATTSVTRPADTTAYAIADTWADSTSAPTSGGFTFSNMCRASGTSGVITGATFVSTNDPATTLSAELWLFDTSVTALNDNAVFSAISDTDAVKLVGVIPFTLSSTGDGSDANSYYTVTGLSIGYTCVGSANLRAMIKVRNVYTPASAEVLTSRLTFVGTN